MAASLARLGLFTALHKHYDVAEWQEFISALAPESLSHVAVSTGIAEAEHTVSLYYGRQVA